MRPSRGYTPSHGQASPVQEGGCRGPVPKGFSMMRRRLTRGTGYTLMEIMMTLVLIAIMAGIAIPTFTKAVERSYWRAAGDVLLTVYAGEQVYHSLNDQYNAASGGSGWSAIYMDNPNGTTLPATFAVTKSGTGAGATFTATGTRDDGSGRQMTINQTRTLCNGEPPASCGSWTKP